MRTKLLILGFSMFFSCLYAQNTYNSHAAITSRLKNLATKNNASGSVQSIGKSSGGKDIWLFTLSKGEAAKKPGVLVVAGADGKHPAGTEINLLLLEKLLSLPADSLSSVLSSKTLYFVPALNPDALEQVVNKIKYARSGNATSTDDDRDGQLNEDPFEDLNGDGLITQVRIEDPTGNYILNKKEPRLLVKADPSKGEKGKYLLISEGVDNDNDGEFNEDGEGGVNIDQNFTFDYPIFEKGAGEYQASEPETRAILDFLYKSINIHTVLTFGLSNNLSEAPKFDRMKTNKRIVTGILEKDALIGDFVSKMYNSKTGLKDAPAMPQTKGNLTQTAYYHAGRFSFTTPGWWVPKVEEGKDSTKKEAPKPVVAKKEDSSPEADFLKWADKEKIDAFVNWTSIKHPGFEGKKAEVGGIAPYLMQNPPVKYLDSAAVRHQRFLAELLKAMPEVQIVNPKVESLQNGVSRVTVQVLNRGLLPTYAEMGDRVRFVYKVKTEVKLANGQSLISGKKTNYRGALDAGEVIEYSWLVNGKGKLTVEAGCPTAGIQTIELNIK